MRQILERRESTEKVTILSTVEQGLFAVALLRTLKLYVGVWYTQGKLEATLSDGSAPAFIDTSLNRDGGSSFGLYTINFKAASSGQSLKIRFTILTQYFAPNGNVAWEAATLQ